MATKVAVQLTIQSLLLPVCRHTQLVTSARRISHCVVVAADLQTSKWHITATDISGPSTNILSQTWYMAVPAVKLHRRSLQVRTATLGL